MLASTLSAWLEAGIPRLDVVQIVWSIGASCVRRSRTRSPDLCLSTWPPHVRRWRGDCCGHVRVKKPIIVLSVLLLLCSGVCGYLILSLPGGDGVRGSQLAEQSLATAAKKVAALEARGLRAGDPEYDTAATEVAVASEDVQSSLRIERDRDEQNGRVKLLAIASGVAGALLLLVGLLVTRRARTSTRSLAPV